MPFMPLFWDATYLLVIAGAVLSMIASGYMNSTYNKYGKIGNKSGMTGAQFASLMLHHEGVDKVKVQGTRGNLTDNYNPMNRTLNLSETTFGQATIGAIGVAGHEGGHAMQHHVSYWAFNLRSFLVPITNFGSRISWPLILVGVLFGQNETLINIGLILFSFTFLFSVVTLPVEFNASNRALKAIESMGVLDDQELQMTRRVLRAAAMTYVSAAAASALSLLRMFILFGGRRRD